MKNRLYENSYFDVLESGDSKDYDMSDFREIVVVADEYGGDVYDVLVEDGSDDEIDTIELAANEAKYLAVRADQIPDGEDTITVDTSAGDTTGDVVVVVIKHNPRDLPAGDNLDGEYII